MLALPLALAMALTMVAGTASAAPPASTPHRGAHVPRSERGQLAGTIVRTWAGYVQQVYGTAPMTWAHAMAGTFAQADIDNLRRAAKLKTYEAMTATLLGQQLTDAQAIDKLARADGSPATVQSLGSPANDLVYTMITPCRIADTRVAGGKLVAGATRDFIGNNPASNFAVQGGNAGSDCGIPAEPSAVVMGVTVVGTGGNGYVTVFPYGVSRPLAASMNYTGVNQILGNEIIVKQTIGGAADFSIYSTNSAHLVIDVVGYFMAPVATALECITIEESNTVAGSAFGVVVTGTTSCPAGYALMGISCWGSEPTVQVDGSRLPAGNNNTWSCRYTNSSSVVRTVFQYARCCRVPGR